MARWRAGREIQLANKRNRVYFKWCQQVIYFLCTQFRSRRRHSVDAECVCVCVTTTRNNRLHFCANNNLWHAILIVSPIDTHNSHSVDRTNELKEKNGKKLN